MKTNYLLPSTSYFLPSHLFYFLPFLDKSEPVRPRYRISSRMDSSTAPTNVRCHSTVRPSSRAKA